MKISQTSVSLLIVAWLFAVLTFYFAQTSEQIRFDSKFEQTEEAKIHFEKIGERIPSFGFYGTYPDYEYNYADYFYVGIPDSHLFYSGRGDLVLEA